ncbi:hypothetical protein AB0F43_31495 [Kribbella sp. NPDC023972]|uniref:hypothetical protein n=1 Tax=Kribbella sp. NPDC023972 TaxID=3154795 RepID=UPI0033ED743D
MKTAQKSPTDQWLAAADLPALDGPSDIADRLLLLVHYGIDWQQGWLSGARYRTTYWDPILPDRVICATFCADSLRRWYAEVAAELVSAPRNADERAELERLIRTTDRDHDVLQLLRTDTPGFILRTRITADAVRAARSKEA